MIPLLIALSLARLESGEPGLSAERLSRIDGAVQEAIGRRELPGAVVLVGRGNRILHRRAYGHRALLPAREPMTVDTIFDVASLTKVLATAPAILILVEQGKLSLSDPVVRHLPEFAPKGGEREKVTVEHLLTHRAGLPPDDPLELYAGTPAEIFARKYREPLEAPPGARFIYSDVGYEVLGELVRRVSGEPLDRFAERHIFRPLGMRDTGFRPLDWAPHPGPLPGSSVIPRAEGPRDLQTPGGKSPDERQRDESDQIPRFARDDSEGRPLPGGEGGSSWRQFAPHPGPLPRGEGEGSGGASRRDVSRMAPTEQRDGRWMRGEVHDPRAWALGGVAGHAGLFSTAEDLARFCRMVLSGGRLGAARILSPLSVEAMARPRFYGDGDIRALGFDIATRFSRNRGDLFPVGSFGHTGFTGTSIWIDPASQTFVVFLSNRVHPDGKGDVTRLRGIVATLAASAVGDGVRKQADRLESRVPRARQVLTGLDVLLAENFRPVAGKRIGLLTNPTGLARGGRSTIEAFLSAEAKEAGVELVRLFSPEHGLRADQDASVPDATDAATGLPIVSLYGDRRRPRPEDLAGLDAVVFDIQDVGARFYTYLTTLGYLLEEAARAKARVVVLDRPNPVNGAEVEGPLADPDRLSFTAYHRIPVRTGMTIGELARLFNSERRIGADLEVVPMRGWSRELWYDETGLEWINPSPNQRSLEGATLYPGIALFEFTNLSVGRGTDTPFQLIGAPWLDGSRLARVLSARQIPGVRFTPIHFTPSSSSFAGEPSGGVRFTVTDRDALRPVSLAMEIAVALRDLHPVDWDRSRFNALLANAQAIELLESGATADRIAASWQKELEDFRERRARYLLY
jgi:uncharacterized protein YbbC (DUF1343 family)